MRGIEQHIEELQKERADLDKDLSGLNGLLALKLHFTKQKKEIELDIYRLSRECEKHHQALKESEDEQNRLRRQLVRIDEINY